MFNQKAASKKSRPDEILKALDLKAGQRVADIGSGGGYFSLRFAEAVGSSGQVFAVDTEAKYLEVVQKNALARGLKNVQLVNIAARVQLPDNTFDLIFFRNVYHHLENRVDIMKGYRGKLKPGGRIAIVEYRPGGSIFSFRRLFGHNVPREKIIAEMEAAGFRKAAEFEFLPEQSFTIFSTG